MAFAWRLLVAAPEFEVQIFLAVLHAIAWQFAVRRLATRVIAPWIMRRPWAARYRRRCYETLTHGYGVRFKDEEHAFKFSSLFAAFVAIHIVGGLLCVPSLLVGQTSLTTALAAQGALIEIGWEASDLVVRAWQLAGFEGQAGRDINPPMLVFFAVCHHTMGTSMILPMNVYFRDNRDYHELVFLLQFGAFVAMFSQAYGYTLDVSTRGGLVRMRRAALWTFVSVLWSRGIRYVVIGARLLDAIKRAGHERMYTGGVAGLLGMMIFNAVVIADCARRLWKFGVRTPMPTPTPTPMRRLSQVDRWRGSKEELIRLLNGGERPAGAPRPRQMSLEEVERHRLSLPATVARRRPAARVAGDS